MNSDRKRAKNAFMFFKDKIFQEQKASGEFEGMAKLSKEAGEQWGKMSDDDKQPFIKLAEEDKKKVEGDVISVTKEDQASDDSSQKQPEIPKKKKEVDESSEKSQLPYFELPSKSKKNKTEEETSEKQVESPAFGHKKMTAVKFFRAELVKEVQETEEYK